MREREGHGGSRHPPAPGRTRSRPAVERSDPFPGRTAGESGAPELRAAYLRRRGRAIPRRRRAAERATASIEAPAASGYGDPIAREKDVFRRGPRLCPACKESGTPASLGAEDRSDSSSLTPRQARIEDGRDPTSACWGRSRRPASPERVSEGPLWMLLARAAARSRLRHREVRLQVRSRSRPGAGGLPDHHDRRPQEKRGRRVSRLAAGESYAP